MSLHWAHLTTTYRSHSHSATDPDRTIVQRTAEGAGGLSSQRASHWRRRRRQGSPLGAAAAGLGARAAPSACALPFPLLFLPSSLPIHHPHIHRRSKPIFCLPSICTLCLRPLSTLSQYPSTLPLFHPPLPRASPRTRASSASSRPRSHTAHLLTHLTTASAAMSESRLDQSLESIISSRKQSTRKGRGGRRSDAGGRPAATAAPVGGVKKSTKQNKQSKAAAAAPASAPSGESKIMISNLVCAVSTRLMTPANSLQPLDVEQNQLQVCKTLSGL